MAEHVCKCKECHPELYPEVPLRTPEYRNASRHFQSVLPTWVEVDGQRVNRVAEALSGDKGWAIFYPGRSPDKKPAHPCICQAGACADVKYGRVVFGPERGEKPCP